MSVTTTSFRATFRAFKDPEIYPDDAVNYYLSLATTALMGAVSSAGHRFDPTTLDHATSLYIAHHLVLDARDADAVATGGVPGALLGPETTATVDKVTVSNDSKAVTFEDEPFWNQTRFGVQLMNLVHMYGAGGVQLGAPVCLSSTGGWNW